MISEKYNKKKTDQIISLKYEKTDQISFKI